MNIFHNYELLQELKSAGMLLPQPPTSQEWGGRWTGHHHPDQQLGCWEASPFSLISLLCNIIVNFWATFAKLVAGIDRSYLNKTPLFHVSERWGRWLTFKVYFHVWGLVIQNPLIQGSKKSEQVGGLWVRLRASSDGDPGKVTSSQSFGLLMWKVELMPS